LGMRALCLSAERLLFWFYSLAVVNYFLSEFTRSFTGSFADLGGSLCRADADFLTEPAGPFAERRVGVRRMKRHQVTGGARRSFSHVLGAFPGAFADILAALPTSLPGLVDFFCLCSDFVPVFSPASDCLPSEGEPNTKRDAKARIIASFAFTGALLQTARPTRTRAAVISPH